MCAGQAACWLFRQHVLDQLVHRGGHIGALGGDRLRFFEQDAHQQGIDLLAIKRRLAGQALVKDAA